MKPCPILLIIFLLFSVSCATIGTPPEIEVAVEHISAPQLQMLESRAVVTIRIDNESSEPITILGGVHQIRVNGRRIGKAMDNMPSELPAFSSVTRQLPITLSNLGIIRSTRESIDNKEVSYQLDSRLSVATATGQRKCSLRREGHVSLEELVPAGSASPGLTPLPITPLNP
ncbi:MAG: LEA14-like dessication related protein [Rhodothermales bacterium]|jgi:LEA14-like dessication related protein